MADDREQRARQRPLRAYALTGLLLVATVPMLPAHLGVLGLPLWVVGSLSVTALYAIAVASALGRYFDDGVDMPPPVDAQVHADPGDDGSDDTR